MVTVSSSPVTALPDAKPWAPACVSNEQHLHGVKYNRESAIGKGPGLREDRGQRYWRLKKNDRDRNTLMTGNSLLVHSLQVVDSRQNSDANQSN